MHPGQTHQIQSKIATNFANYAKTTYPSGGAQVLKPGEFSAASVDWTGYPEGQFGLTRPSGPFQLLEGSAYDEALAAKNATNASIRRELPLWSQSELDWHEIQPVKFGGSPTDLTNKIPLPRSFHQQQVSPWWRNLQRSMEGDQ